MQARKHVAARDWDVETHSKMNTSHVLQYVLVFCLVMIVMCPVLESNFDHTWPPILFVTPRELPIWQACSTVSANFSDQDFCSVLKSYFVGAQSFHQEVFKFTSHDSSGQTYQTTSVFQKKHQTRTAQSTVIKLRSRF